MPSVETAVSLLSLLYSEANKRAERTNPNQGPTRIHAMPLKPF